MFFARSDWLLKLELSSAIQTRVSYEQMASQFAAVTSEEISQINEEAVPEKNEEGDKIWYGIGIYR